MGCAVASWFGKKLMGIKAYICSDLHCEFHKDAGKELISRGLPDADIAVVAGDLNVGEDLVTSLEMLARRYRHVVYVAGNHDYYHSLLELVDEMRADIRWENVHWIEDQAVEIEGVRFMGCTLWFGWHDKDLEREISDFRYIAGLRGWVHEKNHQSLEFLRQSVTNDSIVVTHHLPSYQSIVPQYEDDPTNCFYVCPEAEEILMKRSPRLWVHGHMHDSLDYQLGGTRVICNPFGYAGRGTNRSFKTGQLVLDL